MACMQYNFGAGILVRNTLEAPISILLHMSLVLNLVGSGWVKYG